MHSASFLLRRSAVLKLLLALPLILFFALPSQTSRAQEPAGPTQSLVLHNVNIIDVRSGKILPDRTVIVSPAQGSLSRISTIAPSNSAKIPANATLVDAHGLYLIPGLWDMHVHLAFGDWFPGAEHITLPLLVANGVTGVRDMGSDFETVSQWRAQIAKGQLVGPRIYTSGPMLDGPKPRFPSSVPIATPDDARRAVDDLKRRGVDFIKLQSLIPRDAVFAIAEEARKQQIVFVGHVPDSVRASEMSNAGQKSFEHLIGIFEGSSPLEDEFLKGNKNATRFLASFDPARFARLAALLAKNHTWQCPTLVWERGGNLLDQTDFASDTRIKYVPASWNDVTWKRFVSAIKEGYATDKLETRKQFLQKELAIVQQLHRAGVPFLAGTDTPPGVYIFPGFSLHEELQRFVAAGFSSLEALQTATLNPAKFLGVESDYGTVAVGKAADLVLLSANPLDDIANTQKISAVIRDGRYYSRADLDRLLASVESAARTQR
jgi:imidazolonepropionase-like amidohydrolase